MSEKCKYCDYISKCSKKCEYGSLLCTLNRSFPKIVNKSYKELEEENQRLKDQLQQREEAIEEALDKVKRMEVSFIQEEHIGSARDDDCELEELRNILNKYKKIGE